MLVKLMHMHADELPTLALVQPCAWRRMSVHMSSSEIVLSLRGPVQLRDSVYKARVLHACSRHRSPVQPS